MKKILLFSLLVVMGAGSALARQNGQRALEWEHIFDNTFSQKSVSSVNWMNDGRYFTALASGELRKYQITDNSFEVLVTNDELTGLNDGRAITIQNYEFSADETKLLIQTEVERVWRRSRLAHYYVFDFSNRSLKRLTSGDTKQGNAAFSPSGDKVAFTRSNNLFVTDLNTGKETAITTDGAWNNIINGATDWVHEEEFTFVKAWFWNTDGTKIAFYRFDESNVREFTYTDWYGDYPVPISYKYPRAGEANAVVTIGIYDVASGNTVWADTGEETDQYIVRLNWTRDPNTLSIRRMSRLQNVQDLMFANASTGETRVVKNETSDTWIDEDDDLTFLENGKEFIYLSEEDGFRHIYLYNMDGKLIRQVTKGPWEVAQYLGYNEKKKTIYYLGTEDSPLERHLYSIRINGKRKKKLTKISGINRIDMSNDFSYYLNWVSALDKPTRVSLHKGDGKEVQVMEDNADLIKTRSEFRLPKKEFVSITVQDTVQLNGYVIKPSNFEASKKYPLLVYVYGGPGSQRVRNIFEMGGQRGLWHAWLADQGYIVMCVDNRGTGGRGAAFEKQVYKRLGQLETEDQIAAARYMQSLPYVDEDRIGIWGWSYGGYMSSLGLAKGSDVFKMAIAVAPVTNWKYYDTIYTERFMQTPQLNPDGYSVGSPITYAGDIKGKYLLVHGAGDDNVHFQNSVEMVNALVANDIQFETMYYPNKAHGIGGTQTRRHLYRLLSNFIFDNL